jgi:hypothetical protein
MKLTKSRIGSNVFFELILLASYNTEEDKDGILQAKKELGLRRTLLKPSVC